MKSKSGGDVVGNGILSAMLNRVARIPNGQWVILLFGFSFLLRCVWVFVSPSLLISDPLVYDETAQGIVEGKGYVLDGRLSAYWPVGYPAFLAGVYWVFGHTITMVQIIQALLGAATVILAYKLAATLFDELSGRVAGLLLGISLNNMSYVAVLWSEILFTFLFVIAIYGFVRLRQRDAPPWWYSVIGVLPGFLFGYDLLVGREWRRTLNEYAFVAVCMGLTILPWTIRNINVLGHPVIISTNGGINFLMGNNPDANGRYKPATNDRVAAVWSDEVQREQVAYQEGLRFIQSHPGRFVQLAFKKLFFLLYADWDGIYENLRKVSFPVGNQVRYVLYGLCQSYYLMIMALFVLSLTKRSAWTSETGVLFVILAYWLVIHMLIVAEPRYHFPIMPLIYVLAAPALSEKLRSFTESVVGAGLDLRSLRT
jgi:hypothetical protein